MCELFAMSARWPAAVSFSLEEFSRHGGLSGPHKDGWGIAFYENRDARIIRESIPAASSALERFLERQPIQSNIVLSHIRLATQGDVALSNTQPFSRELGGRLHVFTHNGHLDVTGLNDAALGRFRPLGETDSERAFCNLLKRLEPLWLGEEKAPTLKSRGEVLESFAEDLRELGIANFMYSDGELLFAHSHRRPQADGGIRPPGLHFLCRRCAEEPGTDFETTGLTVSSEGTDQTVVLIASVPLTDEGWAPLGAGETLTVVGGEILQRTTAGKRE